MRPAAPCRNHPTVVLPDAIILERRILVFRAQRHRTGRVECRRACHRFNLVGTAPETRLEHTTGVPTPLCRGGQADGIPRYLRRPKPNLRAYLANAVDVKKDSQGA